MGQIPPEPIRRLALLDNGAVYSLVDADDLAGLNLGRPTGREEIASPSGVVPCDRYHVSLTVLHPGGTRQNLTLPSSPVLAVPDLGALLASAGVHVLIGCDVLRRCYFAYDGPSGRFVLAY